MAKRTYKTDELSVLWDSSRCVHSARCIMAMPGVFDPENKPWVQLAGANTEEVIEAIERCPTGALRYVRADGSGEAGHKPTTVQPLPDGPLLLRGELLILGPHGEVLQETRVALCRCGHSENKPFCDGSHRRVGFRTQPPKASGKADADNPDEVGPTGALPPA